MLASTNVWFRIPGVELMLLYYYQCPHHTPFIMIAYRTGNAVLPRFQGNLPSELPANWYLGCLFIHTLTFHPKVVGISAFISENEGNLARLDRYLVWLQFEVFEGNTHWPLLSAGLRR
jgi:hypothetical protein